MFRFTNLIIFELTRDCNLQCEYCFMQEKHLHKGEIIDFELYKKIINQIAAQRIINNKANQRLNLIFHGGEVTIIGKKNFYKILEYASTVFVRHGITYFFGIQTNGTLLDAEYLKILKKFDVNVGVSFDGLGGANKLRTDPGEEMSFRDKFNLMQKYKIPYGFILVASKISIKAVKKTEIFFRSLGIPGYKINYAEDILNPGKRNNIEISGAQVFRKVIKPELIQFFKTGELCEHYTRELFFKTLGDILTNHSDFCKTGCSGRICGAGVQMMGIRPDGTMGYCDRYAKDYEENFIDHALSFDFLGIHQLQKTVRLAQIKHKILIETGCDTCKARYTCHNGCLAFYYSKYEKYGLEKQLVCAPPQKLYKYVTKHLKKIIKFLGENKIPIPFSDDIYEFKPEIVEILRSWGYRITKKENISIHITKIEKDK